ncbi:LIM zinc-binding domain-containing protein [Nephila pilipes]|uniref:LIM zinc-binding domain-containing protein n=1 Tax=Nephila pilipes TaxID=299642 RepID=A0A8X6QNI5_NEPPI|nr:LIM zinc-binding domain-containing protein [Nephila pilipes]
MMGVQNHRSALVSKGIGHFVAAYDNIGRNPLKMYGTMKVFEVRSLQREREFLCSFINVEPVPQISIELCFQSKSRYLDRWCKLQPKDPFQLQLPPIENRTGVRIFDFKAEKVMFMKRRWHQSCLRCAKCNKVLEAVKAFVDEGRPYCPNPCYNNLFRTKEEIMLTLKMGCRSAIHLQSLSYQM